MSSDVIRVRWRVVLTLALIILCLLSLRVLHGMIFFGNSLRSRADDNRFFHKFFSPPRGIILDRFGEPLVQNAVLYSKIVGDPLSLHPKISPIDEHEAIRLLTKSPELVESLNERFYPFGSAFSHVIGYVGYASQIDSSLSLNEKVGKDGLERVFNSRLKGERGTYEYEMNAHGKLTRIVKVIEPVMGEDIRVSLDARISAGVAKIMEGKRGAVVVSDVDSSQILALVSSPAFDPMHLAPSLTDEDKPLLNRALQPYPPGSVFKMMTALAALKQNTIAGDTLVNDEGEIKVGESTFRNWYFSSYGRTEGNINVVRALARSNDVFFYKVAAQIGPDAIAHMADTFHLGMKTGIQLPGEQSGLIPRPAWKERVVGEKWYLGDTYHFGIGQGDALVTPVQVNAMTAALARRGTWCELSLELAPPICEDLGLKREHLEIVVSGMKEACSVGGTAFPFFLHNTSSTEEMKVACKTGTAEFGGKDEKGNRRTHAWFTMFYPLDKPKVAITVLLESSSDEKFLEGSGDAAPLAKTVWELWLERNP